MLTYVKSHSIRFHFGSFLALTFGVSMFALCFWLYGYKADATILWYSSAALLTMIVFCFRFEERLEPKKHKSKTPKVAPKKEATSSKHWRERLESENKKERADKLRRERDKREKERRERDQFYEY